MAAPAGNQNAKKERTRVSVPLSIGNERRDWAVSELRKQGVQEPTYQQIVRFVKDFCYSKIDEVRQI